MNRIVLFRRPVTIVVVALLWGGLFVLDAHVARASDQDGIAGFSMRLKHKEFDGSESGSGGNLVIEEYSSKASVPNPPVTLIERVERETRTTLVRAYIQWLARWSW